MKPLLHATRRLITTSTAPILAACALSGAALAVVDALISPAAAAPALIVQFTTTKGVAMSKSTEEKVRRPGVAKLAASLAAKGMEKTTAEATAKASLTGKVRIERVPNSDKVRAGLKA